MLLAATSASAYLSRYALSVGATVIEADLKVTHKEVSWVFAAFMCGYLAGQFPGGWLGNRLGTRAGLTWAIASWSTFAACSAACRSWRPLAVSQFFMGLAQAGLVPISSIAVKEWFPASRRGFPSAAIAAAMSAGGVLAMGLTGELLRRWHGDWQRILVIYAAVGGAWSILFFGLFRTKPEQHRWANAAEIDLIREPERLPIGGVQIEVRQCHRQLMRTMLTSVSLWALGLQWFFRSAGYQFFARWFPAFLQGRYRLDVGKSGVYSALPLVGVAVGSLCGGLLVDASLRKTGEKWISRNLVSIVSLVLCAACLGGAELSQTSQEFIVLVAAGAVFSGMSMPTGWAANIDIGGRETPIVFAAMNTSATLAGIVAPTIIGYLMADIEASGGNYGIIVLLQVAIYLAAAVAWLFVNPNRSLDSIADPIAVIR